MKWLFAHFTQ
ncbi:hypothetical protein D043_3019A, partial [Vibrio parahaemolyticus EKP-021]